MKPVRRHFFEWWERYRKRTPDIQKRIPDAGYPTFTVPDLKAAFQAGVRVGRNIGMRYDHGQGASPIGVQNRPCVSTSQRASAPEPADLTDTSEPANATSFPSPL